MRKILLVFGAALALLIGGSWAERASAMTITAPVGTIAAAAQTDHTEQVRYVCRRVWRCGPRRCGWRRVCWWRPPIRYYGLYGPYPYYGWGYRPYWRRWYW